MADVCERHDVKLLTYGTLVSHIRCDAGSAVAHLHPLQCGGFLADKWLDQPEPDLYAGDLTPSQRKASKTCATSIPSFTASGTCRFPSPSLPFSTFMLPFPKKFTLLIRRPCFLV